MPPVFESQIRLLRRAFRPVAATELVEAACSRQRGQRFPVAVTFDDDLSSHVEAAEILRKQGIAATFFLSGRTEVGLHNAYWWELIRFAAAAGRPPAAVAAAWEWPGEGPRTWLELEAAAAGLSPDEQAVFERELRRVLDGVEPDALAGVDPAELRERGHQIGSHTAAHRDLTRLSDDDLRAALGTPPESRMIAYPHGRADARVARAAREAGYELGFTTDAEPVTPDTDPLLIGRVYPSSRSAAHLGFRILRTLFKRR